MARNREDKALHEFKNIMEDLLHLVVKSTGSETGYLYWVNRSRDQFVLESYFTGHTNVMFKDRINFEEYFLDEFKNITEPIQLKTGVDLQKESLSHYHNFVPANHIIIIPFRNNDSTVALTVLETRELIVLEDIMNIISSYVDAHMKVLNTYLELTELYQDQKEWDQYDEMLEAIGPKLDKVKVIDRALEIMQRILPGGGVLAVMRGMDSWVSVLRSSEAPEQPSLGLAVHQKSMVNEALEKGEAVFSIHFNQNPKRLNGNEQGTEGASLAIPLLISERRQAVILCFHSNPLIFKDSIKHQLKNVVRIAALSIEVNLKRKALEEDVFTNQFGSFAREVWELCLEKQLGRIQSSKEFTWFGLISISNLSELRSRLRLDDLNRLQRIMVKALNPSRLGKKGFIGFNTDYVFTYMFFGSGSDDHKEWQERVLQDFSEKIDLGNELRVDIDINFGSVLLKPDSQNTNSIINEAKHSLADALKKTISNL